MRLTDVEKKRSEEDRRYDGFLNIEYSGSIGLFSIAHRETRKLLGLVDGNGNIVLPMIYDAIEICGNEIKTTVVTQENLSYGLVSLTSGQVLLGAEYRHISHTCGYDSFWCLNRGKWYYSKNGVIHQIPPHCIPLDNSESICYLKMEDGECLIKCVDSDGYCSQKQLRNLVCGNRIKLNSRYYGLTVIANVYGQVILSNPNIGLIISQQ